MLGRASMSLVAAGSAEEVAVEISAAMMVTTIAPSLPSAPTCW
jgi:hypothetical protein